MLPTLNESPRYSLTIPSTGKNIRYRPYLVKEEKILLMASETKDPDQILNAIIDTISACTDNKVPLGNLTSFDVEYIFIKLRAKSVGEKITLYLPCQECKQRNEIEVNLDDVKCPVDKKADMMIKLDDKISLEMRYPSYKLAPSDTKEGTAMKIISQCIAAVHTDNERIDIDEEDESEVQRFLESMTREQFDMVTAFIKVVPAVEYTIKYDCNECGEKNEVEIKGMQSFF